MPHLHYFVLNDFSDWINSLFSFISSYTSGQSIPALVQLMSLSPFHHFIWNTVLLTEPFYHAHSTHSPLLLVSGPLYKCKLLQLFFMSVMASTFLGSSWSQTGAPKYCRKCFLLVYLGIHQKLNFRSIKLFGKADKLLCPASPKMSSNSLEVCLLLSALLQTKS